MRRLRQFNRIVLFLLILPMLSGAFRCGYHAPPEYTRIFDLPSGQIREEYQKLPLDKQVDMYLYAMHREPPSTGYMDLLGEQGEKVIPYLIDRLRLEDEDYAKYVLIRVFERMQKKKYYDVRNDQALIEILKTECVKIKDRVWRADSEQHIDSILSQ